MLSRSSPCSRSWRLADEDAQAREMLSFVASGTEDVDRIGKIVNQLRRFTTLDTAERVREGLDVIVKEAEGFFQVTHRGSVEIDLDLQPTPPMPVIRFQIEQMVLNLLTNAADAMPQGGTIRLRTRGCPSGGRIVASTRAATCAPARCWT